MEPAWNETLYDFSEYRLSASQQAVRVFALITGALNLALLFPDIIHIEAAGWVPLCALRLLFSGACAVFFVHAPKFRSFKAMSAVVAAVELLADAVFVAVYCLYRDPDFLIQLLGTMIIILVVFMVPGRLAFSLSVAIISAAAFLIISYDPFAVMESGQYSAAIVYLLAEIALGFTFGLMLLKYQRREHAARIALQRAYATDPLTQVGNRFRLETEAEKWLAFCSRHGMPLSLVLLDIDNMKQINDQHGHLTGDATICELVQTICAHLRRNDVCVRWGGDEFVLLLPGTNTADAIRLVERIRSEVEDHVFSAQSRITCSFGITGTHQANTLEKLLRLADLSLYQAKKQGKNTACSAD